MDPLIKAAVRHWVDQNLKPLLHSATKVMRLSQLAGILIGYGVSMGKGDGMSDAELRTCLEEAMITHQKTTAN